MNQNQASNAPPAPRVMHPDDMSSEAMLWLNVSDVATRLQASYPNATMDAIRTAIVHAVSLELAIYFRD